MHQTPTVFFTSNQNYPSPPGVFLYPSSCIPHPALFASTAPIPQIRFCLPPPPIDFYCDYIYPDFSSIPISMRYTLLYFKSTIPPPRFCLLCLSPAYPSTLLHQLPPPPPLFYFCYIPIPRFYPTPVSSLVFCTPGN